MLDLLELVFDQLLPLLFSSAVHMLIDLIISLLSFLVLVVHLICFEERGIVT